MKTDLLVLAGTALLLVAVPMVSLAEEDDARNDDWATRSPLAFGEPMEDCDTHHVEAAVALQPALPAKVSPDKTTRASPRHLSPATLLTFALIASPGTALPQTAAARD